MRTFKSLLVTASLLTGAASSGGCFFQGYDGVFLESEDVSLDVPQSGSEFREDGTKGDVYTLVTATARDVNGWVTGVVELSAIVVRFLNEQKETSRDGEWRVYGPFDDNNGGKDLSWGVRITGDELKTSYEILVGTRGTDDVGSMDKLLEGQLEVNEEMRSGNFSMYFDTVEAHEDIKSGFDQAVHTYAGTIEVVFERNTETELKTIDMDFQDFVVEYTGYLDDDVWSSDESYNFHRNDDGSGTFFLGLSGQWDTWGWSGPEIERMVLQALWTPEEAGRARGQILESADMGDLKHGDLQIDECFDLEGNLTWRMINEEYVVEVGAAYNEGDEADCLFTADEIEDA